MLSAAKHLCQSSQMLRCAQHDNALPPCSALARLAGSPLSALSQHGQSTASRTPTRFVFPAARVPVALRLQVQCAHHVCAASARLKRRTSQSKRPRKPQQDNQILASKSSLRSPPDKSGVYSYLPLINRGSTIIYSILARNCCATVCALCN